MHNEPADSHHQKDSKTRQTSHYRSPPHPRRSSQTRHDGQTLNRYSPGGRCMNAPHVDERGNVPAPSSPLIVPDVNAIGALQNN